MTIPPLDSFTATELREALTRRLQRRSIVNGQIRIPAVPGMIDEYVHLCEAIFAGVGRRFTPEQLARLTEVLTQQLSAAHRASPRSDIVISFDAPVGTVLNYHVAPEWVTIEGAYDNWIATRQPPLFGTEPDARVWALAQQAGDPISHPVLDIGAGTGRNTVALARRGHPVDVVELNAHFAEMIRADAERQLLNVRVIRRDVFETTADLRRDYRLILLSEVVPEFRTTEQLRSMFELASECLTPGGQLVFNTFLARHGYVPDAAAREFAEQAYSNMFTWDEMSAAVDGLPLTLVSDDSVYEYEEEHLPAGAWPPTGWYAEWVTGQDVFDLPREQCPNEMRWLVYRKG